VFERSNSHKRIRTLLKWGCVWSRLHLYTRLNASKTQHFQGSERVRNIKLVWTVPVLETEWDALLLGSCLNAFTESDAFVCKLLDERVKTRLEYPQKLKDTHRWVPQSTRLFSMYHPLAPLHWIRSLTSFSCDVLNVDLNVGPVDCKSAISSTEPLATRNDMYVSAWHDKWYLYMLRDLASSIKNLPVRKYTVVYILWLERFEFSARYRKTLYLPHSRIRSVRFQILKIQITYLSKHIPQRLFRLIISIKSRSFIYSIIYYFHTFSRLVLLSRMKHNTYLHLNGFPEPIFNYF
jgi:hypothetical protein